MISTPKLDEKLKQDTYLMGMLNESYLLLNKNALYPWFILVPDTDEIEFYKLTKSLQIQLLEQINKMSNFIEIYFNSNKLNVATIGNVVSQLHIHIIGRHPEDACWPAVVWGNEQFSPYDDAKVSEVRQNLTEYLGGELKNYNVGV